MRGRTVASFALLLVIAGCGREQPAQVAVPVRTVAVETIEVTAPLRYSANISPYTQVELGFKSGGLVHSIRQVKGADGRMRSVQEGDRVAKGTVLASVRADEYRQRVAQAAGAVARASAAYEKAALDWERAESLFAQQALTKPDHDAARAQRDSARGALDQARAQLAEAEIALRDCSIVAPVDGWILKRNAEIGMVANPMGTAFVLADTRMVKAVFGVPDMVLGDVRLGKKQLVRVEALADTFTGQVTGISPAADPKSRVYAIEVTIQNPKEHLRTGMIASVEFGGETTGGKQAAVPISAVVRHPELPNAFAVYVVEGEPAVARVRAIEPGDAHGNRIIVVRGLRAGERVIATGATLVRNGDPVNVIP